MTTKLIMVLIFITSVFTLAQTSIEMTGENAFVKREFIQNNEKFTFAILGDKTTGGVFNWPIFDRAVREINLLQPDFVVMIGDMIQGTVRDTSILNRMWKEFNVHAEKLDVPLYVLPGNHDISNEAMYDYWNRKIGLRYYSFIHNNSLFILLNTEEYKKTKDGEFGREQLNFVREELNANKDVNQTFIFFHRPLWYEKDAKHGGNKEWSKIQSLIKNRDVTLFAGHWHNLEFQRIEGNRHIVLSATGGELEEKPFIELGYFHHYTLVTVDKDTSTISYIKPGSIFPEDIANKKYISKFENLVKSKTNMTVMGNELKVNSDFTLNNLLDKNISYTLIVNTNDNSSWKFENNTFVVTLPPEDLHNLNISGTSTIEKSLPFPNIEYAIKIDGEIVEIKSISFTPNNDENWRYPKKVEVIGGFDLGTTKKPQTIEELENLQISNEITLEMDHEYISSKSERGFVWQEADVTKGKIALDNYFEHNNFALGYIKFIINSDIEQRTLASMRPDNYAKVYLNGKTVLEGYPLNGVPNYPYMFYLDLKKGENTILIKTADYFGSWYIDFNLLDSQNKIEFLISK